MTLPNHYMTAEGSATVVFPFLTIQGNLLPRHDRFEREVRAGVDGIGIWNVGNRGEPFTIQTMLDCVSEAAAFTAFAAYLAAVLTKKDLYYADAKFGTVLIHSVQLIEVRKLGRMVGGIQGGGSSGAALRVQWTLETIG